MRDSTSIFDLAVVGGGPAGASAAIRAAHSGARTLLLERGRFPRSKVCGEFVSAESLNLLSWLLEASGQDLLKDAVRIPEVRLFCDGLMIPIPIDPPAASIARYDMDAALWKAASACGVETRASVTVQAVKGDGPFTLCTNQQEIACRAVINASGRWSNLNLKAPDTDKGAPRWLGVKAHFAEDQPPPSVDLYFFEGGYCGVQPVTQLGGGPDRINVCAVVRADVASTVSQVLQQDPALLQRSRKWRKVTDPVSTSPLIFGELRQTQGDILVAGDAAAFVDPFVGDGISLALRSGDLAARSLQPFFAGRISLRDAALAYRETHDRDLSAIFRNSARLRGIFFLLPRMVRIMVLASLKRTPGIIRYIVKHTR